MNKDNHMETATINLPRWQFETIKNTINHTITNTHEQDEKHNLETILLGIKAGLEKRYSCTPDANNYYQDFRIAVLMIPEFDGLVVLTNNSGETKTVCLDEWYANETDILDAYIELYGGDYSRQDEKDAAIDNFRNWLIETGADPALFTEE